MRCVCENRRIYHIIELVLYCAKKSVYTRSSNGARPHKEDGTVTYQRLTGEVELLDVDFGYNEEKLVLHNIDIDAQPLEQIIRLALKNMVKP